MRLRWLYSAGTLSLASLILGSAPAQAQYQGETLEEIVVTAHKREQNLQDVPTSLSVLAGQSVDRLLSSGQNVRALAGRVPSLYVESSNGRQSPRFYIRGLGNIDFDVNANQPISLVLDDVPLENPVLRSLPLFDVKRVEVLRGPQGTLFGRNTTAGIIMISSVEPDLSGLTGYASVGYGSRQTRRFEGAFGFPLRRTMAARLSLKHLHRGDWIDNRVNGVGDDLGAFDEFAWRAQWLYEPTRSTSARLKIHGFHQDGNLGQAFFANGIAPGQAGLRPGFDERIVTFDGSSGFFIDHVGGSARLQAEVRGLLLTSVTGYDMMTSFNRGDVDGGLVGGADVIGQLGRQAFFNVETGDGLDDHAQFSQELRLSGFRKALHYQAGGYYFNEAIEVRTNAFDSATGLKASEDIVHQETESAALFGHAEIEITEAFSATGGLRLTADRKDLEVEPRVGSQAIPASTAVKDRYLNWDISATWHFDPNRRLYARMGTASRGPTTGGRFGITSVATTETLTSIEFGLKSQWLAGRLRWNATAFAYRIDDHQLTATGGEANTNLLLNAERSIGRGAEADLEMSVTRRVRLRASASLNDTEIRDPQLRAELCGATPACTSLDPVVGMSSGPFGPVTHVSIHGNPLPRAPKWLFNLGGSWAFPLGPGTVHFDTDWNYRSAANIFLYEAVEFMAGARWIGGLRLGYGMHDDTFEVAIAGRNVINQVTVDGAIDFLNLTAIVSEPSFWGFEVQYRF